MLVVLLAAPQHVHSVALDWGQVAASFAFLPWQAANGLELPILTPGWTLNYEIFFYAAMALLLASGARIGNVVLALAALFAAIALAGWLLRPETAAFRFWSAPLILEFVFGAAIGVVWLRRGGRALARGLAIPLALTGLGLVGFWFGRELWESAALPRWLAAGLPSALIVAAAALFTDRESDTRLPRWAVALGDSSYALYLSHRFTLRAATLLWPAGLGGWAFVAVVSLVAIAVGHAVYRAVERPLLAALRARWLRRDAPARTVGAAP